MRSKRLLYLVSVISMMIASINAYAENTDLRFGVLGGFTSSSTNVKEFNPSSVNLYHAGVSLNIPIAAGFAIQPSLLYQVKGAALDKMQESGLEASVATLETKVGYVELPVQLQWGPDLLAFRPYVFAEPFVGVGINTDNTVKTVGLAIENSKEFKDSSLRRLEYGFGIGGGIEFWRLQLSAKYFWNFGSLYQEGASAEDTMNTVAATVKKAFKDNKNFNGFSVSLAIFF